MNKTVITLLVSALALTSYKLIKFKEKHNELDYRMNKVREALNDGEIFEKYCQHCEFSSIVETAYLITLPGMLEIMENDE